MLRKQQHKTMCGAMGEAPVLPVCGIATVIPIPTPPPRRFKNGNGWEWLDAGEAEAPPTKAEKCASLTAGAAFLIGATIAYVAS